MCFFFFKQKTAYEMRISDWSSDVCSSDLIVLAVNKMDLVDYDRGVFDAIVADYRAFTSSIGIADFTAIPLSGLRGDNIAQRTEAMAWYAGPTLIEHLEGVAVDADADRAWPFRMPVQWVNRPNLDFRDRK